jgi:predicted nucleotidyltransferase
MYGTSTARQASAIVAYNKAMSSNEAISILRAHETELKAAGVRSLRIFGSVARDESGPESDIDLEAAFENVDALTLLDIAKLDAIYLACWATGWNSFKKAPSKKVSGSVSKLRQCLPFRDHRRSLKDILDNISRALHDRH